MILTERILRNAAQDARSKLRYSVLNESLMHFDSSTTYDLFISHSYMDKELVIGLSHLFVEAGYKVYIDWIDDKQLDRSKVTTETAAMIKTRIKQSRGMSYIATTNSNQSKWCPWELGVSDAMKGRTCILPVMDHAFQGQEYLGLYPYLVYDKIGIETRNDFWITDQDNPRKTVSLRLWLNGSEPYNR